MNLGCTDVGPERKTSDTFFFKYRHLLVSETRSWLWKIHLLKMNLQGKAMDFHIYFVIIHVQMFIPG